MSKYTPLQAHLCQNGKTLVAMSFDEIEALLGFALPPSAHNHRAWWSNNPTNNVMTKEWLEAGYETEEVDLRRERLVFRRTDRDVSSSFGSGTPPSAPQSPPAGRSIIGVLEGTVTLHPRTDLTEPTGESWQAEA